jgi:Zn ribbon nucleic-acid-binding protein
METKNKTYTWTSVIFNVPECPCCHTERVQMIEYDDNDGGHCPKCGYKDRNDE